MFFAILNLPLVLLAAGSGGADIGGGGDGTPYEPVTSAEIRNVLELYRAHQSELLNALAYSGVVANRLENVKRSSDQDPLSKEEWQRIHSQADIYRRLFLNRDQSQSAQFNSLIEYRVDHDCLDRNGEARDASVVVEKPYAICMSLGRLQKKLSKSNFEIESLALYLHEVSHLLGADEEQATFIQAEILAMGPNFKDQWNFLFQDKAKLLNEISASIKAVRTQIFAANSKSKICSLLSQLNSDLHTLFVDNNVQRRALVIGGLETLALIHYAMVVIDYSYDYCGYQSQQFIYHRQRFGTDKVRSVGSLYPDPLNLMPYFSETQRIYYSQFFLADMTKGFVQLVNEDDLEALRKNLAALEPQNK